MPKSTAERTRETSSELAWGWRVTNAIPALLIRFYKVAISPYLPPSCRFQPSCSQYALEAFQRLPFHRALGLSVWRIVRCNPFVPGGYDPVPPAHCGCTEAHAAPQPHHSTDETKLNTQHNG